MNNQTFIGNLGADPVLRQPRNSAGKVRATFSIAVTTGSEDREKTHWLDMTAFGDLAEHIHQTLKKGMRVIVAARLDSYVKEIQSLTEDANGNEVVEDIKVNKLTFIVSGIGPELTFQTAKVSKVAKDSASDFSDESDAPAARPARTAKPVDADDEPAAPARTRRPSRAKAKPEAADPEVGDDDDF